MGVMHSTSHIFLDYPWTKQSCKTWSTYNTTFSFSLFCGKGHDMVTPTLHWTQLYIVCTNLCLWFLQPLLTMLWSLSWN